MHLKILKSSCNIFFYRRYTIPFIGKVANGHLIQLEIMFSESGVAFLVKLNHHWPSRVFNKETVELHSMGPLPCPI